MRKTMRYSWRAVAAAGGALILTACSSSGGAGGGSTTDPSSSGVAPAAQALGSQAMADQLEAIYNTAVEKGESSVVIYAAQAESLKPVFAMFQKRYPKIKVNGLQVFGAALNTRVDQEFSSGKHVADLFMSGGGSTGATAAKNRFVPYSATSVAGVPAPFVGPNNAFAAPVVISEGIGYNTDKVSSDEAPKTWNDLLDPKWKGKLCMGDPTSSGGMAGFFTAMLSDKKWGYTEDYLRKLAAQKARILEPSVAENNLYAGHCAMNFVFTYDDYLTAKEKGAPIEYAFPEQEGSYAVPVYLSQLVGAPHPAAADLLRSWLYTPEAATGLAKAGFWPTAKGSPSPQGLPPLDPANLIGPDQASPEYVAQLNSTLDLTKKIFG